MIMSADYMDARREGREEGREEGRVLQSIDIYREEMHLDDEQIKQKIMDKFSLDESEAKQYMKPAKTA